MIAEALANERSFVQHRGGGTRELRVAQEVMIDDRQGLVGAPAGTAHVGSELIGKQVSLEIRPRCSAATASWDRR